MLKTSFSLSSLRGPNPTQTPPTRPYNSLTKKRKQYDNDSTWFRCCNGNGSTSINGRDENKDDFWAALQPNYNYIMDNHLIESCTEAKGELLELVGEMCSFRDLAAQFSELYSWLNSIQESVYIKDEGNLKRQLEEMERRGYRRTAFIEQATRLVQVYPEIKDEVSWRITHLNSKWDAVKQAISLADPQEAQTDVEHEVRCLRKWMHEMESRLGPLSFRRDWTLQELEGKALEHAVLQKDIESHGKIVSSILKLCNKGNFDVSSSVTQSQDSRANNCKKSLTSNLRRAVLGLERRWHLLFLRSLEWQCHIESLHKRFLNTSPGDIGVLYDSESDEEPVQKQPRLSSHTSSSGCRTTSSSNFSSDGASSNYSSASSDNEISTSSESDGESYFEDGIESTCVLSVVTNFNNEQDLNKDIAITHDYNQYTEMDTSQNINELNNTSTNQSLIATPITNVAQCTRPKKKSRVAKQVAPEVCAPTTKIDYNGPNNVTYYCQHRDTDSGDAHTVDQSSEDEWTFESNKTVTNNNNGEPVTMNSVPSTNGTESTERKPVKQLMNPKLTKDEIHRLVQKAEKLVSTPAKVRKPIIESVKYRRVKEWLNRSTSDILEIKGHIKTEDPCDASGEYTTGESDAEKESQSSEDLNESVATYRQVGGCTSQATSTEVITEMEMVITSENVPMETSTPKVNLRSKRNSGIKSNRPWSVACISSLQGNRKVLCDEKQPLNNFSISESALHELASLSLRTSNHSVNSIGVINALDNSGKSRTKKMRVRKYTTSGRKSESGSDVSPRSLHKSGSFSGAAAAKHNAIAERNISSEPTTLTSQQSQTSSIESDDDVNKTVTESANASFETKLPDFKLGGQVLNPIEPVVAIERDSSPEKTSLNTTGTEEYLSSLSEWDNYLEKYMSEPYSETPDSEAARRLLEFGEDYRNYIDSQSDCCSSLSARTHSQSPAFVRRYVRPSESSTAVPPALDSESDVEEYRHVIRESRAQLYYTEDVFGKQITALEGKSDTLQGDFAEIMATCRENLYYLQVLLKVQGNLLSTSELRDVKALLESWTSMQVQASDFQRARTLDRQISDMRAELINLAARTATTAVSSRAELTKLIEQLKTELGILQERKRVLLHMNVAVHRFLTDCVRSSSNAANSETQMKAINACSTHLKDRISDLYRLWTETYDRVYEQLNNLQGLHNLWSQLELRLEELQGALRSDENTLRMLDTALQGGAISADVATSVRDVAKVLSEKKQVEDLDEKLAGGEMSELVHHHIDACGSFSDSGISDEGSEQELSERERRLAMLRRLARQLESALAPGSEALQLMSQRIEQTETELRDLQRTCRALIVRTAVCAEVRAQKQDASTTTNSPSAYTNKRKYGGKVSKVSDDMDYDPDDDDDDDPERRPWLWRVMRASLPFQLAIVALFYVACLLEPHCCDRINNLSMSFTPQLRYIKGPPPV